MPNISTLLNVSISNDPKSGLSRVVDLIEFIIRPEDKYLRERCKVYALDINGDRLLVSPTPYIIDLYADNNWVVDPSTGQTLNTLEGYNLLVDEYNKYLSDLSVYNDANALYLAQQALISGGAIIEQEDLIPQPNEPIEVDQPFQGVIGEWDFWTLYSENPIELYPALLLKIQLADQLGRFDIN